MGHLAFRFLVGPSTDELAIAEPYYVQQRLLMFDGFVRAQHLVQQRQPVVVIVNEQEDLFPDDDNVFLEGNIRPLIRRVQILKTVFVIVVFSTL